MKKIGIITFHTALNYGAVLQCYALTTFLNKYSEASIIDYSPKYFDNMYRNHFYISKCKGASKKFRCFIKWTFFYKIQKKRFHKMLSFEKFVGELPLTAKVVDHRELTKISILYDAVIVGSDQVWNMKISNYDKAYVLDFVPPEKRFCYAASFGKSALNDKDRMYLEPEILHFQNYYVREDSGIQILKDDFNIRAELVSDPTALLTMEEWDKIASNSELHMSDYVLIYLVAEPTKLLDAAVRYATERGKCIIIIGEKKVKYKASKNLIDVSPNDFVKLVKNCDCFFTTSYHGIMFSLIYNKNFYYELNKKPINNNARIIDLISKVNLADRDIDNFVEFEEVNWDKVNLLFIGFVNRSKDLLVKLVS